jgi:hypothetical protein
MDWPHDPDGEEGSEGGRSYGHAVLVKTVDEDEDFPLPFDDFAAEYGDDPVRIDHEQVVAVSDIVDHVDVDTADDITEFHRALGRAMRSAGYWPFDLEDVSA